MDSKTLTEEQASTLAQFRGVIKDCKLHDPSDVYLLRWLIARDFNIKKAEDMLRASVDWRKKNNVNSLLDYKPPEVLEKYLPTGRVGLDKSNYPVWVVRYGRTDMKGLLLSTKKKDYINYTISLMEKDINYIRTYPERHNLSPTEVFKSTMILDMTDFGIQHITHKPTLDASVQYIQFYEANYPEVLRRMFIVNAPKLFGILFNLVKPFLNGTTFSKIMFLGPSDSPQTRNALLAEIDADQLPACYGGTITDPDGNPNCLTLVNMGGTVPKSYYLANNSKLTTTNKTSLKVSSGGKNQIQYELKAPKLTLRWEFHCEGGDIGFGIYQEKSDERTVIVTNCRVDCDLSTEEGEIVLEPGQYVLEFDNSFSYLRSKTIWYRISAV